MACEDAGSDHDHGDEDGDEHDEHGHNEDANSFELVGLAVGSGIFNVSIFHDGHADYTSMPIIVTVEEEPQVCIAGDTDNDGLVNVTDVVYMVNYILLANSDENTCFDMDGNGFINVVDVVYVVNIILGVFSREDSADYAVIETASNELSVRGVNGTVDGVQLTLSHGADFSIDLVETSGIEVAAQRSIDENTTIVLVAKKDLTHIGTTTGDYTIVDHVVVATNRGEVVEVLTTTATEIVDFRLGKAYPNPFNPTTNLELAIPEAGYVSVKVYNLVGQEVATLVDGMMDANPSYTFQWNAGSLSSGVYLVRAEGAGQIATQKLMLLK